jgi:hypothetical protein
MKALHGSRNWASCPDDGLELLPVAAIGRGSGLFVRIDPVLHGFSGIRTRSRTICPDLCKTPARNQESRHKSRQLRGIGFRKPARLETPVRPRMGKAFGPLTFG